MTPPSAPTRDHTSAPGHRADASMSLLVDLMTRDALDQGYAAAARRRAAREGHPGPKSRGSFAVRTIALLAVGLLLAVAALTLRADAPAAAREKSALRAQVAARTTATDHLEAQLTQLRIGAERLRDADLAASARGARAAARLAAVELATAALPVTGPGLEVTLDDAPAPVVDPLGAGSGSEAGALGTILDSDIQSVVNALWASGAEAIAIDGQRLSALSAIRSAGSAVLVDFRPLTPPYVVTAIGDPRTLAARFADTRAARTLHTLASAYGMTFRVAGPETVTLPAASGLLLRHATPGGAR